MDISFGGGTFRQKCHTQVISTEFDHLHRVHGGYDHYLSTSGIVRKTSVGNENTRVFACFNQPLPECDWQKNAVLKGERCPLQWHTMAILTRIHLQCPISNLGSQATRNVGFFSETC